MPIHGLHDRWHDIVSDLPGIRPLYPVDATPARGLGERSVPYVFPAVLADAERAFPAIRRAGIALYRWEELAASECRVSASYRTRLVQLPCHQEIDANTMNQMSERLAEALRGESS